LKIATGKTSHADVDLAPLIDVTFLLIVFFMSIWQAAHIEVSASLSLPRSSQGNPQIQQDRDRLIINIDKAGDYYIAKRRLSRADLTQILRGEVSRGADASGWAKRPVFIRADANLPFSEIRDVMLLCREMRVWKLGLRTRQERKGTP
jgi:biopolymer transport protein ExbD